MQNPPKETVPVAQEERQQSGGLLESREDAEAHRVQRGDPEPIERGASGLGRHYDIGGGRAEFGPTDTERNAQVDERDIPSRVP